MNDPTPTPPADYEFHPRAQDEVRAVATGYREISNLVHLRFERRFREAMDKICRLPELAGFEYRDILRRRYLKKYPYKLIYRFNSEDNRVQIIAFRHKNRRPLSFSGRLEELDSENDE